MELKRSVLLPYSAHDMFDLIEGAEHYPQFVPWCVGATILERSEDWVAARLEFSYLKLRFGFRTRNPKKRPHYLRVRSVEGPFRFFHGDWDVVPVGDLGCRVSFTLNFEVADGPLLRLVAPAVDRVARTMVEAFVKRAHATLRVATNSTEFAGTQVADAAAAHTARVASGAAPAAVVAPAALPPAHPKPSSENDVSTPEIPLIDALRASPLAQYLTPEQTAVLAGVVTSANYAAQAVIAPEGSSDTFLYVVCSGQVDVVRHRGTPDETFIASLRPGDLAHELGFLDEAERFASLVAAQPTRLLVLDRLSLESLIDTQPRVVYGVMRAIARTVHRLQTRLGMQANELTNYIVKQHGRY